MGRKFVRESMATALFRTGKICNPLEFPVSSEHAEVLVVGGDSGSDGVSSMSRGMHARSSISSFDGSKDAMLALTKFPGLKEKLDCAKNIKAYYARSGNTLRIFAYGCAFTNASASAVFEKTQMLERGMI